MGNLIGSIMILVILVLIIARFKENINKLDISIKIGAFSVVVAILGNILGVFEPIGYLVQKIAIVVVIMSIIIELYLLAFKRIIGAIPNIILFSFFLFMIFTTLNSSRDILNFQEEIYVYMTIGRSISIFTMIICVVVKVFNLIFGKNVKA